MILKLKLWCVLSLAIAICFANQSNRNATSSVIEILNKNETSSNGTATDIGQPIIIPNTTPEIDPLATVLPHNTFQFNGRRYFFNTGNKLNKFEATKYCTGRKMFLVDIYSAKENDWIVNKIRELGFGDEDFWTGDIDAYATGNSDWNHMRFYMNNFYTNWGGKPVRVSDRQRLAQFIILSAATGYKWSSEACRPNRHYFICKDIKI